MKITWISSWFGDYRIPIYEELDRLSEGWFRIICSEDELNERVWRKLKQRVDVHAIGLKGQRRYLRGNDDSDFANKKIDIRWQSGLYKAISRTNPDVVIVEGFGRWAPLGVLYAKIHRKTLLMFYERTCHTERDANWLRTVYRKIVAKIVDGFLTNGSLSEEYLREKLKLKDTPITSGCMAADSKGLNMDEIPVYQNGIGLNFLYVGQLVERKGIYILCNEWVNHHRRYPNDTLSIVGDGCLKQKLEVEFSSVQGIQFIGSVSYERLGAYYSACDVFIMPTLEDNWSLVVPEAMSCGKAIACSIYNGGYPELVKDGENGFLFDPRIVGDLERILSKFHQEDVKMMGGKSKVIEDWYSVEKASNRIYNACLRAYESRF